MRWPAMAGDAAAAGEPAGDAAAVAPAAGEPAGAAAGELCVVVVVVVVLLLEFLPPEQAASETAATSARINEGNVDRIVTPRAYSVWGTMPVREAL
jgi:hypothetical protein